MLEMSVCPASAGMHIGAFSNQRKPSNQQPVEGFMKQTGLANLLVLVAIIVAIGILAFRRLMVNNPEPRPSLTAGQAGVAIPAPASDPVEEIDRAYAEQLFSIRFAIAANRYRAWNPDSADPGTTDIRVLEDQLRALLAEIDSKKALARKKPAPAPQPSAEAMSKP